MYMRMLQLKIRRDDAPGFVKLYEERIIPALEQTEGCVYACLLRSTQQPDEGVSLTLWQSEGDSLRYEQTGLFKKLVEEARPFFADASEWTLQLSKDFKLEYNPEPTEPRLETFVVSTAGGSTELPVTPAPTPFLRIVSLHLKPGKLTEYKELYERDIVPKLLATRGCQFTCLSTPTKSSNEAISVTLWNSRANAEEYERTGTFKKLLQNVSHTLSDLTQLTMQSAGSRLPSVTSEDVAVDGFQLLAGKSFR
jgi:quinol monooxygenase YgiN